MMRVFIYALAFVLFMLGITGAALGSFLVGRQSPAAATLFPPLMLALIPLLPAGIALIFARPWAYYLQFVALALMVLIFVITYLPLGLSWTGSAALFVFGLTAILAVIFLLPPIRRYFGVAR